MTYSIVLLVMIIGTVTAFLPYSFLIYNTPPWSLGQHVFAQGDGALEDSSGDSETRNGAEESSEDSGLTDGTEPTGGGGGIEGPVEEVPSGDNGDVIQFDEFTCYSDSNPPSCQCFGVGDCVKMVLSGQCKDGTWKETGDDSGDCDWKVP